MIIVSSVSFSGNRAVIAEFGTTEEYESWISEQATNGSILSERLHVNAFGHEKEFSKSEI